MVGRLQVGVGVGTAERMTILSVYGMLAQVRSAPHPHGAYGSHVVSVSFSPEGQTLTSGRGWHDRTIRLWDVSHRRYPPHPHGAWVQVSQAYRLVRMVRRSQVGVGTSSIRLWDVQDWRSSPHPCTGVYAYESIACLLVRMVRCWQAGVSDKYYPSMGC